MIMELHCMLLGNLRKAWAALFALGKHSDGRTAIARAMKLCGGDNTLNDEADVNVLAQWAQSAWDYMAMVRLASCYRAAGSNVFVMSVAV
jgi:hypothetical protein